MEVGQSGQINGVLAVDPRERPHGLALQCEAKENQERFEEGLEFWHFTRLGRLVKKSQLEWAVTKIFCIPF